MESMSVQSILRARESVSYPKNGNFNRITLFFDMISTFPLELVIGVSMMLSDIVIIVYYKVSEWLKSLGTSISPVKLCKYCKKWNT